MSKLSDMIAANRTDKRFRELEPLSNVCYVTEDIAVLKVFDLVEYKISVTFGAAVQVSEESRPHLQTAIKRVKRSVIEAVFGEFRADFRELHRLLWERKYDKASIQLEKIEQRMFEV